MGKGCIKEIVKLERLSSDNHFSLLPCKKKTNNRNMAEFPGWEHLIIQVHYGVVLPSFVLFQHQKKNGEENWKPPAMTHGIKVLPFFSSPKSLSHRFIVPNGAAVFAQPKRLGFSAQKRSLSKMTHFARHWTDSFASPP